MNLLKIQVEHTAQYQKNKQVKELNRHFSKEDMQMTPPLWQKLKEN